MSRIISRGNQEDAAADDGADDDGGGLDAPSTRGRSAGAVWVGAESGLAHAVM